MKLSTCILPKAGKYVHTGARMLAESIIASEIKIEHSLSLVYSSVARSLGCVLQHSPQPGESPLSAVFPEVCVENPSNLQYCWTQYTRTLVEFVAESSVGHSRF